MVLLVLEVDTGHGTEWLLTDDLQIARQYVASSDWREIAVHDPADIIASQYQGLACLSTC